MSMLMRKIIAGLLLEDLKKVSHMGWAPSPMVMAIA